MGIAATLISTVAGPLLGIIDKYVTDKDKANELKSAISHELIAVQTKRLEAQEAIITAEAKGESWLQRNWRPLLMVSLSAIVVNNFLLAPYLEAIFHWSVTLELPNGLWDLLNIGVGGYVLGRSAEKVTDRWSTGRVAKAQAQTNLYNEVGTK